MIKINSSAFLKITAGLLMLVLACCSVVVTHNVRLSLQESRGTLANANRASAAMAEWAEVQNEEFKDPRRRKAIDAAIELPAVLNGSARTLNRFTLPKIHAVLDSLNQTATASATLVSGLNKNINQELLPAVIQTAKALNVSVGQVNEVLAELRGAVRVLTDQGVLSIADARQILADVHALMSDPSWTQTLKNIEQGTKSTDDLLKSIKTTTDNIGEATKHAPNIAASLDKIARASSKYQKLLILAQLFSTLLCAF